MKIKDIVDIVTKLGELDNMSEELYFRTREGTLHRIEKVDIDVGKERRIVLTDRRTD